MEHSHYIARSLIDYHEKNCLNYDYDEYNSLFEIPMYLEDSKIQHIFNKIRITNDGYFCSSVADIHVNVRERHNMFKYIMLINYELNNKFHSRNKTANFSFDFFNGEISYNQSNQCGDIYLSDEEIDNITSVASSYFYVFGEGFFNISNNYQTPEEAVLSSFSKLDELLFNSNNSQSPTYSNYSDGNQESDFEPDGWDDLNPYDMDDWDYDSWADSFD